MAEIEEVIRLSVEGTGDGIKSVKSLKQEIRETQAAAISAARKFGEFSPEATKAAKKVALLKDEMGDFQQRVAALNPDKFQAIAGVVGGISGGIAAAQGAMALFGAESEDTQKALLKVQGALAFSQGVQQILDLRNSFGAVANVIKTQVVAAFSTLKGAIAATGIGLLVIAIGIAIQKLSELGDEADKSAKKIESSLKFIEDVAAMNELDLRKDIANAKVRGASEDELDKIRARNYNRRVSLIEDEKAKSTDKAKFDELLRLEAVKADEFYTSVKLRQAGEIKAAQDKTLAENKAFYANELQQQNEFAAAQQAIFEQMEKENQDREVSARETLAQILDEQRTLNFNSRQKELDDLEKWYDEKTLILIQGGESTSEVAILYESKVAAITDRFAAQDKEKSEKDASDKLQLKLANDKKIVDAEKLKNDAIKTSQETAYNSTASALGSIAQLFGQATAAGKAAAILQIGLDEARAISGALANSQSPIDPTNAATGGIAGVAKFIAISASILSGFARVKQILGASTQSPNVAGAGGNLSSLSVNSGYLPTSDQTAGQLGGNNRVYVLEGDISRTQTRVRNNRRVSVI